MAVEGDGLLGQVCANIAFQPCLRAVCELRYNTDGESNMENIVQSNNRDLRLVAVKVGVLSTLRLALPDVPANATRVEVIVTNGDTHTAYGAHLDTNTERWLVDVAAEQFPSCGKQKYEIAYLLDGKQFWDGAGWVTVEDATTGGLTPSPSPDPARYVVTRINGYGAPNPDGEVRIPRTFVGTEDPTTTDGFIEFDQYFNRTSREQWVLCSVTGKLTWVKCAGDVLSVNGKSGDVVLDAGDVGAYTKEETDVTVSRIDAELEKKLDKTAVVAPSESATEGQAADAKVVGSVLKGFFRDDSPPIFYFDEYNRLHGNFISNGVFVEDYFAGNGGAVSCDGVGKLAFQVKAGLLVILDANRNEVARFVKSTDLSDATKLTPVLDADGRVTGYKLGDKTSPVLLTDDAKAALFAGAVISSTTTELTNMACSVVPFADGMTITFAASTGLRQCEVLITGCTEGAALNVTATKLRGDADALTLEAGDNHLTFAEYATGEFFVTRHVANEIA